MYKDLRRGLQKISQVLHNLQLCGQRVPPRGSSRQLWGEQKFFGLDVKWVESKSGGGERRTAPPVGIDKMLQCDTLNIQ